MRFGRSGRAVFGTERSGTTHEADRTSSRGNIPHTPHVGGGFGTEHELVLRASWCRGAAELVLAPTSVPTAGGSTISINPEPEHVTSITHHRRGAAGHVEVVGLSPEGFGADGPQRATKRFTVSFST